MSNEAKPKKAVPNDSLLHITSKTSKKDKCVTRLRMPHMIWYKHQHAVLIKRCAVIMLCLSILFVGKQSFAKFERC